MGPPTIMNVVEGLIHTFDANADAPTIGNFYCFLHQALVCDVAIYEQDCHAPCGGIVN